MRAVIIVLVVLFVLALISAVLYYYCYLNKEDDNGRLRLREWIKSNKDTIDVTVFDSPKYRQSVLEPRPSEAQFPPVSRFSIFNQNPFANAFHSSVKPKSPEGESGSTIDEQYQTTESDYVPITANPAAAGQSNRRQNSVRIHLPITRDTEVFGFNM